MRVWVFLAGAVQARHGVITKAEIARLQTRMLSGQDQARADSAIGQGFGEWGQLDCFGPRANDEPYVGSTQPSP